MKKALLTLALAAFAFAANAQWIIGGQIDFSTAGGTANVEPTAVTNAFSYPATKSIDLTFNPTISYVLNDNMQVGLSLSYTYSTTTNYPNTVAYYNNKEEWTKTTASTFGFAPYFRYYFAQFNKFNFFCEAALDINITPRSTTHVYTNYLTTVDNETKANWSNTSIGLTIVPGVNYRINDNWSADCYIDLAGLYFTHNSRKIFTGDKLDETRNTNNFGLMADASAQRLNAQFGNIRIGINYHF